MNQESEHKEFYERGRALWRARATARDMENALASAPPEFKEDLRRGVVEECADEVLAREGVNDVIWQFVSGGPETDRKLRFMLPNEEGFNAFKQELAEIKSAVEFLDRMKSAGRFALAGLAGAAIGLAVFGLARLGAVYALYIAGASIAAVAFSMVKRQRSSVGTLVPLLLALLTPLILGAVGFGVYFLLSG